MLKERRRSRRRKKKEGKVNFPRSSLPYPSQESRGKYRTDQDQVHASSLKAETGDYEFEDSLVYTASSTPVSKQRHR